MSTYLYDVATEISTRFTFGEPSKGWAIWSPGGDRIAVTRLPGKAIEVLPVFGSTDGEILWEAAADEELSLIAQDWSPDGSVLLAMEFNPGEDGQYDIWVLPLDARESALSTDGDVLQRIRRRFVAGRSLDGLPLG